MSIWIFAFIASILLIIFTARKKFSKKWQKVILIILEICLSFFFILKMLFPLLERPEASGPNKVDLATVFYKHETKFPQMATDGKEREIPVKVYFPEKLKKKSHPLFLFSHGSFGIASSNETLFYELASRGYIVMSLDHPGHAFFTTLSSGKNVYVDRNFFKEVISSQGTKDLEGTLKSLNSRLDPRIEDINFVLDKILDEKEDNIFEDKIDPSRIILSGHSLGGSAVLALGRQRPEDLRALVVLEAPFVRDILGIENDQYIFTKEVYPKPILHIYSDALWGKMDTITTYSKNQELIDKKDPNFVNKHISGTGHIGLTDMSLASPILTNAIDGGQDKKAAEEVLLEENELVLDFLEDFN
jgi:pimeloyl-ACP methyl ester carboxylesterase